MPNTKSTPTPDELRFHVADNAYVDTAISRPLSTIIRASDVQENSSGSTKLQLPDLIHCANTIHRCNKSCVRTNDMIFIKLLLTVAAIVHLVACSDDAEGSSTSTSFEVNSTPQYDDITESNENSSSDVSTVCQPPNQPHLSDSEILIPFFFICFSRSKA